MPTGKKINNRRTQSPPESFRGFSGKDGLYSGAGKLFILSVLSLILTSPFFLYPLFERPSLSQAHYISLCGMALCALFCLVLLFSKKSNLLTRSVFNAAPVLVFHGVLYLSAFLSPEPWYSVKELLFITSCSGLAFFLIIRNPGFFEVKKILVVLCFTGFLAAIYGVLQNYGIEFLGYSEQMKKGKLSVVSIFGHPNYLAAYLAPLIFLLAGFYLDSQKIFVKIISALCILVIILCLLLAGTRGAWLSLILSFPVFFFFTYLSRGGSFSAKKFALLFCAGFLILALLVGLILPVMAPRYNIRERLLDSMPLLSRFYSWRMAGEMLRKQPFFGVGFGRYKVVYWDYVDEFQKQPENRIYDYLLNYGKGVPPVNVHNEYLEFAAEAGIAGFAAFIFLLMHIFGKAFNCSRKNNNVMVPAMFAAVFCILVDSVFNFPLHQPLSALMFWMLAGLLISSGKKNRRSFGEIR